MIVIVAFLVGAIWGSYLARARGGGRLDALQYGVAFGLAAAIAGLFLTVALERLL